MSVEMDRVRHLRCSPCAVYGLGLLDDPVGPDVGYWQLDQVLGGRKIEVALLHIGHDRLFPVYVDGRQVDAPHDDVLFIGGWIGDSGEVNGKGRGLGGECGGVYVVGYKRYEWGGFGAAGGLSVGSGAVRVDGWSARVAENGRGAVGIGIVAAAAGCGFSAEPVVIDGLVGFDDYIITLADAEEEPFGCYGFDGD